MLDSALSLRVPAEHLGQARLFRSAVLAEDRIADAVLAEIEAPLPERLLE
jgi:hypothetical protein